MRLGLSMTEATARSRGSVWRSRRRLQRNLVGLLVSIGCLAVIAWRIDLDEFLGAVAIFHWGWMVAGVLSLMMGYTVRIVRWSSMLRAAGADVGAIKCAAPFLGSIALNNVLPMRIGDFVRAWVFPASIGVGRATATSSLVMERLVDLMTLLACFFIGMAVSAGSRVPEWLMESTVVLSLAGGIGLAAMFFFSGSLSRWVDSFRQGESRGRRQQVFRAMRDLLCGFEAMSRLPMLFMLFILSMLVWVGEAGLFWFLLKGFGLEATIGAAMIVMSVATLSTLVPSSPGYIGPFHLAAFSAIAMLGGTSAQAASFAVLAHMGVWLPTTIVGAVAILLKPQLFSQARAVQAS